MTLMLLNSLQYEFQRLHVSFIKIKGENIGMVYIKARDTNRCMVTCPLSFCTIISIYTKANNNNNIYIVLHMIVL